MLKFKIKLKYPFNFSNSQLMIRIWNTHLIFLSGKFKINKINKKIIIKEVDFKF